MICPICGHVAHDGERCDGLADGGAHRCACSYPDPGNYTVTAEMTPREVADERARNVVDAIPPREWDVHVWIGANPTPGRLDPADAQRIVRLVLEATDEDAEPEEAQRREAEPRLHELTGWDGPVGEVQLMGLTSAEARRLYPTRPLPGRWRARWRARLGGYFWLPCPVCGQWFGGHEPGRLSVATERQGVNRICCQGHDGHPSSTV